MLIAVVKNVSAESCSSAIPSASRYWRLSIRVSDNFRGLTTSNLMVHLHGWAGVMTVKCMVTQRRSADTAEEGWDCVKKTRSLTSLR